ncbi:ABC transporter substrate-binding protein [Vogesella sp. LYT5W]|uniref:ABC transporter substrate-binding protein n=1 Tax=Vogesella margarita TaxID=2984199 RepID=A0ABT5IRK5_9NEIS|nr:ABC transporter substrate-binding protein [Vogesella margarita]MDC7714244.1 ABC transporter substrate-binding protein [Vogesella margarita]
MKIALMSTAALLALAGTAEAATLRMACGAPGPGQNVCIDSAKEWAKKTGHEVKFVATPNDSNEQLALLQQLLGSGSDKIDVMQIDVVWPGILANQLLDLKPYSKGAEAQHFGSIITNNTVAGKLVAMPWYIDTGMMYYRKDLLGKYRLPAPSTWDEMAATARKIQDAERAAGNDKMWGFVWQGRAYEGLTCNALEWLASFNGGTVVDAQGKVSVNNPYAGKALDTAAKWVGTISPKAVLNFAEEEARGVFQSGNAVFMRNWPYAWSVMNQDGSAVKGKVGVMPLPKGGNGGRHAATLGGWQLAVSKYSKNPQLAADLLLYMTGAQVQKYRAIKGSFNPTIPALYKDPDIIKASPFMAELYPTFSSAVPRPSTVTTGKYNQVSNQFWNATHDVLSGNAKSSDALAQLDRSLKRLAPAGFVSAK